MDDHWLLVQERQRHERDLLGLPPRRSSIGTPHRLALQGARQQRHIPRSNAPQRSKGWRMS
jgi:hypothetical protein